MAKLIAPAFQVPLAPGHLSLLGYLAVVWGQVDFLLDEILAHAHHFDKSQRDRFLTDKPIGGKVDMLSNDLGRLPEHLHEDAKAFALALNEIKQRRNAAFHGVWGLHLSKRHPGKGIVAANHHRMKNNPLKASDLQALTTKAVEASQIGYKIWCDLADFPCTLGIQFTWGADGKSGGPPEWMRKSHGLLKKGRPPTSRKRRAPGTRPKAGKK